MNNFEKIKAMDIDEIEKLYENAKIKKKITCSHSDTCYNGSLSECEGCNAYQYPKFTAEKQLELIKWLGSIKDYTVEIDKFKGVYYIGCREAGSNNKHWGSHNLFDKALAELINDLWQSLTDTEKAEIKRILE